MIFITFSSAQAAQYAYTCMRLKNVVNKMCAARKTIEAAADASFDKLFAKSVQMLTSESLQCENEMRAQINTLVCNDNEEEHHIENKTIMPLQKINSLESVCGFFENTYFESYDQLLKDKKLEPSLKNLIQNHLIQFKRSLTQLRLFNDVKTLAN